MQAAAATAPAPRHRVYTAVEPRCEWARAADADTLVVDVSGFVKEELRVLYNTSRKLKVAGERPVGDGGARWARFLSRSRCLRASAPAASGPSWTRTRPCSTSSCPRGHHQQQQVLHHHHRHCCCRRPWLRRSSSLKRYAPPHGERKGDGSSGGSSSSNGSFWSAQEDAGKNRAEEKNMVPEETKIQIQEEEIATADAPRTDGGSEANTVEKMVATMKVMTRGGGRSSGLCMWLASLSSCLLW
ncbi:hypothetical protein ZWY2020_037695 [Hordeum vulgare]|nr:hypothetical protein ZWY2020_037695 [Hordeum vulgare]